MIKYRESEEMYLETILILKQKSANVHAINVADELGYSRPSVSRGVNLLVKNCNLPQREKRKRRISTNVIA